MGRLKTNEERLRKRQNKILDIQDLVTRQTNGFRQKFIEKKERELAERNKFKNSAINNSFQQLNVPQKKG